MKEFLEVVKELNEKRSWVRKGFENFISELENLLREKVGTDAPIVKIGEYTLERGSFKLYVFYEPKKQRMCCDVEIVMCASRFSLNELSIEEIKELTRSIPEVFGKEVERLKAILKDDLKVLSILENLNSIFKNISK